MLYSNLEIAPDDLPRVEEPEYNPHPPRYKRLRMISITLVFLILSASWIVLIISGEYLGAAAISCVWGILFLLSLIVENKAFGLRGYLVRGQDVSYREGLFFRSITSVPYNRIQHSEVSHGPIERMMKLATLKIFTAGGSSSDLSIHGLDPAEAERLREWITEKTAQHV